MASTIRLTLAGAALLLLLASCAHAQGGNNDTLTANGTNPSTVTISAADLVAGTGSALATTKENGAGDLTLSVVEAVEGTGTWQVKARRSFSGNWPVALTVRIKRTGSGTGSGTISSGLSYIEIGSTDTNFFTGTQSRSGVPIQLELSGLSLAVPPDTYTATITFTMYDAT